MQKKAHPALPSLCHFFPAILWHLSSFPSPPPSPLVLTLDHKKQG